MGEAKRSIDLANRLTRSWLSGPLPYGRGSEIWFAIRKRHAQFQAVGV
jgi:hypothetical protein